jgi:hypothetical protein
MERRKENLGQPARCVDEEVARFRTDTSLQNRNDEIFGRPLMSTNVKTTMKTIKAVVATALGIGFAFGAAAQPGKHPGEKVDLKSLPAAVQETINQKAAGGDIVRVIREDDPDGKWNYEVVVKTNGKESGFEVDPNGRFVKHHEAN